MNFIPEAKIDFHDFGPMTEFDIEQRLLHFLEDCHIAKFTSVLVVTGKGQVVRPLVARLLNKCKFVKSHQTAGYFNGQTGAFEVVLEN